ncbi:MAG: type IV pilus secretin PilQ, partial [Desulfamplus sp.]|nr:type IV pilus secretin PilQ [Desulfamplus sp.]
PWDQVLDLVLKMNDLGKVREGSIIRIATLSTLKREEAARQEMFAARKRAIEQKKELEPLITEYIPINYSSADTDIRPHLEKLLTPERGQLSVDRRTNMIILTDVKEKLDQARKLIFKLDKVTPQIMISARIVEVNKDFSRELGVDWNISSQDVYRSDMGGLYGLDVAMNYPSSAGSGIGYTFNRIAGTPMLLDARLTASELNGDSKIISSPKILTLDNKTAKIDQGLEYGYQSGVDQNGNPVIAFKPVKLSLEVTPQVTPDKRVAMTVKISKNEVSGVVANVPSLSTNEAQTELLVNDGNTIVIGGIVKTNVSESRTGFPFLSEIPYLGNIFRSDVSSDRKNELLIFITPTIVQLDQRNNVL